MNSNKLRPQSANFRKVSKPRPGTGSRVNQPQDSDRWSTIYRESTKANETRAQKAKNEVNDFSDLVSVRSLNKSYHSSNKPSNKENLGKNVKNGFFVKKPAKKTVTIRNDDSALVSVNKTNKVDIDKSGITENPDPLKSTIQDIINKPLNTTNPLGQKEHYLDPTDASKRPAHTKTISNANDPDFLKKNLHALYKSSNEYYPLLGGECLCGYCICGNCKCVHMKFKNKEESSIGQPISRTDFVNHCPTFCNKQIVRPQQTVKPPNEFVKDSLYKTDYQALKPNSNEPRFMNKAKLSNLGPTSSSIKAPIGQMTNNKLDYPDWGYRKTEPLKVQPPPPMTKKMPSSFKTQNQDYGAFFNEENAEPVQQMARNGPKRTNNFFGPKLPMDYDTQQRKDFKDHGKVSTEKRVPRDNLYTEGENFATRFRPVKQEYGDHPKGLNCPVKERIKKVKEIMRAYANENMIPL